MARAVGEPLRPFRHRQSEISGALKLQKVFLDENPNITRYGYTATIDSESLETLLSTHTPNGAGSLVQYTAASGTANLTLDLRPLQDAGVQVVGVGIQPVLVGNIGGGVVNLSPSNAPLVVGTTTGLVPVGQPVVGVGPQALTNAYNPFDGFWFSGDLLTTLPELTLITQLPALGNDLNHMYAQAVFYRTVVLLKATGPVAAATQTFLLPFKLSAWLQAGEPVVQ